MERESESNTALVSTIIIIQYDVIQQTMDYVLYACMYVVLIGTSTFCMISKVQ